ncbi:MAG: tetraacyldisaccharide 4'-kinase [Proteobacteria bacterium]|nr:tetraacyldisaccharide 4'-kinase [Pseudomonadota bacterium]
MPHPKFWRDDNGLSQLLLPLAIVWNAVTRIRMGLGTAWRAPVPVVCVGNLVVGGAGKTPLAIALARHLIATGHTPHFLSRGYGGRERGPVQVDLQHHDANAVGDEPLLLAAVAPTWVARNRPAGARMACAAGADVIVMDDGFQNPTLAKDISVLAIDGGYGFGNHRVMPAGPLRERLSSGLWRADAAVVIGTDATGALNGIRHYCAVHKAHFTPYPDDAIAGKRVFAFAGIGRPEKFYATLRQIGCTLAATKDFPDHHFYTAGQIMTLCEDAAALDAIPVTTEKDYVRLSDDAKAMIHVLRVELEWADMSSLDQILNKISSDG